MTRGRLSNNRPEAAIGRGEGPGMRPLGVGRKVEQHDAAILAAGEQVVGIRILDGPHAALSR